MIAGHQKQHEAGFTLVETLVSLAIMGMAAVILTAGIERIGLGMQIAGRTDNQLDALASAQRLLRQRLALIQPVTHSDLQAGGTLDFIGHAQSIDFTGPVADRAAPDALQHYRLQRDPDGGLVLRSVSTLDPRLDAHGTSLTLLPGTTRIAISYLGQSRLVAEQHAVWQADWSQREGLPMLVRISVGFADGDHRHWPELVVHPLAATPEPCPRDAVTGGCATPGNVVVPKNLAT